MNSQTEEARRAAADAVYDAVTHCNGYGMEQLRDGSEKFTIYLSNTPENEARRRVLITAVASSYENRINLKQANDPNSAYAKEQRKRLSGQ